MDTFRSAFQEQSCKQNAVKPGDCKLYRGKSLLLPFYLIHPSSKFSIPAVISQNVTNKSCLVCVKSEKYAIRPLPWCP